MAEKYKESTVITPEEESEIERILSVLPGGSASRRKPGDAAREASAPQSEGQIQDITSMVQIEDDSEADFPSASESSDDVFSSFPSFSDVDLGSIQSGETESESLDDIPGFPDVEDADGGFGMADESAGPALSGSTESQLGSILGDEPDSVDDQDLSSDIFVGGESAEDIVSQTSFDDISSIPFDDAGALQSADDSFPSFSDESVDTSGISLDGSADFSVPDLSDMDISEKPEMQDADINSLPDLDFSSSFDESSGDAAGDFDKAQEAFSPQETLSGSSEAFDGVDDILGNAATQMNSRGYIPAPESGNEDSLDLTVHEMRKLKNAIKLMPFGLMKAVKDTIVNDKLSKDDTSELVNLILDGASEEDVQGFIEDKLGIVIDAHADNVQRRKIYARNEYTQEGRARQKILLKRTRNISIAVLLVAVLGVLGYQYIYKPLMAKHLINEGVQLIRRNSDPKTEDYVKAEELFREVDSDYVHNYLYGYNAYGRAYFDKKEYDRSVDKLNKGYKIAEETNFAEYEILNNLGYFYSKVPARYFAELKPHLKRYYYEKTKPIDKVETQLDVALDFYRKASNKNPDDITSLYGIGNAYFYQGEYLKARKYFEDIIRKAPDSPIGYSGLLNLLIERDSFAEVTGIYVKLRDKEMLSEVPSALLAKTSWYMMSKKADEDSNVRIDFGIQSPRLKDSDDNPFPVVADVLKALKKRDPEYPPLYLHYAKLALLQRNPALAEKYLQTALDKADDRNDKYFGALTLLGEFYYMTKDPVKSYKYLRLAESAYQTPAEFTYDEFYKETESIGKNFAIQGNLFYYFFDKIKLEQEDLDSLESDDIDRLEDKMENYSIARGHYERALTAGYESSELHYNLGRIYYMNRDYEATLTQWLNLYPDFTRSPELMFSLGNVFLKLNNLDSAKAQYTKVISIFEIDAGKIKKVDNRATKHIKIFETLTAAYNNLGAVYQLQNNEAKSSLSYWKSIEYAQRLGTESEYSRVNLGRSFKQRTEEIQPLINDNIPYSLQIYREDMRI